MKNIRSILIINLFLFSCITAISQEKTDAMLFGDVKSGGIHIPYVNIIIKGTNMGTMTDATGHYKLANLPIGKITVIAQSLGYKTQEKDVEMKEGKVTELFFELEKDPLQLEQVVITGKGQNTM